MRFIYNTPYGALCIILFFDLQLNFAKFINRQNQSVQKTPYTICMSAQPLPIGGPVLG